MIKRKDKPAILIVDDTLENLFALEKLLNKLDVEVFKAGSGNEALAYTLYNDFALIILDVQMPEMDGYEVAELLKSEENTANIPIIFVTAIDRDSTKEIKGYDKGAVDYIFKPFNEYILLSKVKVFLELDRIKTGLKGIVNEQTEELIRKNDILKEEIEKRIQFEKDLICAKEKAERSDRLKSEFLAQISHEIRTPVNTIFNYMELFKSELDFDLKPDQREYFDAIEKSGDRIIRTVSLILNMSEIQSGSYECVYKEIPLYKDVLNRIYSEFQYKAKDRKLDFILNQSDSDYLITADQYSIEQIFVNLIDNAVKYTHEGRIEISAYKNDDGKVCVKIADTGIGITEEYLPDLFQPFSQEEQGYTRKYEGNGLGLALVKKYCDMNKADITVESKKGKGSAFTVKFR